MSRTALLIGGPADGKVTTVENSRRSIVVSELAEKVRIDVDGPYIAGDVDNPGVTPFREVRYYPRTLLLFGSSIRVWAPAGYTEHPLNIMAAKHLLSPLALTLVREGA